MEFPLLHYNDGTMDAIASQITSITIVYSTVYSDADQRKHQSSASLAFVRGIHRWPVNSPHKWPVTRKMFPIDDVIMAREHFYIEPEPRSLTKTSMSGWLSSSSTASLFPRRVALTRGVTPISSLAFNSAPALSKDWMTFLGDVGFCGRAKEILWL